jgi:hypothetical protein
MGSIGAMFGMKAFEYGLQQLNNYQNSALGYYYDRKLMSKEADYNRTFRQTAYQDTMNSMRDAGLNPILAYQQGAGQANVGSHSAKVGFGSPGGSSYGDIANSLTTLRKQPHEKEKIIAELDNLRKDTARKQAEKRLLDNQNDKVMKEIERIEWENRVLPLNYASAVEARQMDAFRYSLEKEKQRLRNKYGSKIYNLIDRFLSDPSLDATSAKDLKSNILDSINNFHSYIGKGTRYD